MIAIRQPRSSRSMTTRRAVATSAQGATTNRHRACPVNSHRSTVTTTTNAAQPCAAPADTPTRPTFDEPLIYEIQIAMGLALASSVIARSSRAVSATPLGAEPMSLRSSGITSRICI